MSFMQHMSPYTVRPASVVIQHISRCHMRLQYHDLDGLAQLLTGASSLKGLEVMYDDQGLTASDTAAAGSAIAARATKAAVAVHGLQSLTINMAAATRVDVPADLLVPLIAAAGGPGSSLEKLELVGPGPTATKFVAAAAAADDSQIPLSPDHSFKHNLRLVFEAIGEGVQQGWSAARLRFGWGAHLPADFFPPLADCRWYRPLLKLNNLCELILQNRHTAHSAHSPLGVFASKLENAEVQQTEDHLCYCQYAST